VTVVHDLGAVDLSEALFLEQVEPEAAAIGTAVDLDLFELDRFHEGQALRTMQR
jgi:hypothetical protein